MKKKIKKKENKKTILAVALVIGIVVVVAVLLMLIGNKMRENSLNEKKEAEKYNNWLAENCECLEKNKIFCPGDFELNGSFCVLGDESTSRLIGCSLYNCSGEIKTWNNVSEVWEDSE